VLKQQGTLTLFTPCLAKVHIFTTAIITIDTLNIVVMEKTWRNAKNAKKLRYIGSAFFVKEYFPVPSSGGNQCKNRHAPIWHFG